MDVDRPHVATSSRIAARRKPTTLSMLRGGIGRAGILGVLVAASCLAAVIGAVRLMPPSAHAQIPPDLSLTKTPSGSFVVGNRAAFTLIVSNAFSAGPTTGAITVTDTLPNGLTFVSSGASAPGWSCQGNGQDVTCTHQGSLGFSTLVLDVEIGTAAVGQQTNTATVSTPGDSNPANNSASAQFTVSPAPPPDLSLIKGHAGSFFAGSNDARFVLTVGNAHTAGSTTGPITVTDTLPNGITFRSFVAVLGEWSCQASGQVVTCTSVALLSPMGIQRTVYLDVDISQAAVGPVTNTATVSTPDEVNLANNSASDQVTVVPFDLTITKTPRGYFFVGSTNAWFDLGVRNATGASPTPSPGPITVTDVLPSGLTFRSFAPAFGGWSCHAIGQVVTCTNPGPLATSGSSFVSLQVDIAQAAIGQVTNTATVSVQGEANTDNNSASVQLSIDSPPPPDLSMTKSHSGAFFVGSPGARFTVSVFNAVDAGPTTGAITVTDTLPNGLTFRSFNSPGSGWSCQLNGQVISCSKPGPMVPGGQDSFSFGVNVGQTAGSQATNTATVSTPGETNTSNNSAVDQATITPPPPPDLSLTKQPSGDFFVGSSNAWFTFSVFNAFLAGPTTGPITVTDTLPNGLTFREVDDGSTGWSCLPNAQVVTCTHAGPLGPGESSSFLALVVNIGPAAVGQVTNNASVSTPGDTNIINNTASSQVAITPTFGLTVNKAGTGSGIVFSNDGKINCGNDCSELYPSGAVVNLTASANGGSTFVEWSGACNGPGSCQVSMNEARTVTAAFRRENVGVVVDSGLPAESGDKTLNATLTARSGCGSIDHIQFGDLGTPFANANVTVVLPNGGPSNRTTGFTYTPPPGTTSVSFRIQRVMAAGSATVSPIRFYDGCGEWRTFVGGGPDAFR